MKEQTIEPKRLKRMAQSQRRICISIVLLLVSGIGAFIYNLIQMQSVDYTHWTWLLYNIITLYAIIQGIFLAANVYNSLILAIILGLFLWTPVLNVFILLVMSQRATMYLKQNGIKVGLFGADPSQFK